MYPALIWPGHRRDRSGAAPALEELQSSGETMRRKGSSHSDGGKHVGLCDSDRGPRPPLKTTGKASGGGSARMES